jgi:hypothetical protein
MGFSLSSISWCPTGDTVREPGCTAHFVGGVFDEKLLE